MAATRGRLISVFRYPRRALHLAVADESNDKYIKGRTYKSNNFIPRFRSVHGEALRGTMGARVPLQEGICTENCMKFCDKSSITVKSGEFFVIRL